MSEYIIHVEDAKTLYKYTDFPFPLDAYFREEIVRCINCKFYHKNYCEKRISPTASPSEIFWIEVKPNGFCAWGERRE